MTSRSSGTRVTTIGDVARAAGVSLATVSRVMNGRPTVDAELSARVRDAARELGYRPSPLARGLVSGRTDTVAMVLPNLESRVFQAVLHGFSAAAARADFRVLVGDSRESLLEEVGLARDLRRRADGIVLCSPRMAPAPLAELVAELAPAVVVNRLDLPAGVPRVPGHFGVGAEVLLDHLLGLGHRRVLYLAGPGPSPSNRVRLAGIERFTAEHPDVEVAVRPGGTTLAEGHALAADVRDAGFSAVITFNDLLALGLLHGLDELGVDVPGELSVAGFDDVPFAGYCHPPLTTIALDYAEAGAMSWRGLALGKDTAAPGLEAEPLQPRLVVRASTGPVS